MRVIFSFLLILAFSFPSFAKLQKGAEVDQANPDPYNDKIGKGLGAKGTLKGVYYANENYVKEPETNGKADETVFVLPGDQADSPVPGQNTGSGSSQDGTER